MVVPPSIQIALSTRAACVENPGALAIRRAIIEVASVDVAAIRAVLPPNVKYEKLQYRERSVLNTPDGYPSKGSTHLARRLA